MKKASAIALVCGVWLSGSVAFAGSAADWVDAEVAANQNAEAVQMMEDETFRIPALPKRLVKGSQARKEEQGCLVCARRACEASGAGLPCR